MKSTSKRITAFFRPDIWVTLLVILLVGVVSVAGLLQKLDYRIYDYLLAGKPAPEIHPDIATVNVDDQSIEELGVWPWSRDILADAIVRMRELGAKSAVFDIEYISPSQMGVDPGIVKKIPAAFGQKQSEINEIVTELSQAVASGGIPPEYLPEVTQSIIAENINPLLAQLFETTAGKILRDNDEYFGKSIRFAGNAWLTINATKVNMKLEPGIEDLLKERFLLSSVSDPESYITADNAFNLEEQNLEKGMTPALITLMKRARGAGFTNVIVDSDGSRRRIELLAENGGRYIPQLIFGPMLSILDTKEIERTKNKLIIKNALFPGETERRTITIPLDSHGRMLINWIPNEYKESFKYESVFFLKDIDDIEKSFIEKLEVLGSFRLGSSDGTMLSYYDAVQYLLNSYKDLSDRKTALFEEEEPVFTQNDERFTKLFEDRAAFFEECKELKDPQYLKEIETVLESIKTPENTASIDEIITAVRDKFAAYASDLDLYTRRFTEMKARYTNAVCVLGFTAASTTDMGVTPFWKSYPNVGTHANVFNTIMTEQFIYPLEWYTGFALASILCLVIIFISHKLRVVSQNIIGAAGMFIFPIASVIMLSAFRIYMPVLSPSIVMLLFFLSTTILRFITAEKDKSFLRRAFSTYLSGDVVDQIVNDPSKLTLGGEEKNITALFTDIKSFSTLSEKVTPAQLVAILNEYLTLLSDIILEHNGTIDKYIGDAIVSFFGAPIALPDHAWRACLSAVRMKQAEAKFNERMLAENKIPMPIYTRIGVNTGQMIVGNMGTDMKMNYTIMGNDVNLAARLEGVNKAYASWILISESTWSAANTGENTGKLVARRLDRVRVVGIETPVQLYNIVGLRAELSDEQIEEVKIFHQGLDRYLQRDFANARTFFEMASRIVPEAGPAKVFAQRCTENITQGVAADWDGVINMTSK